MCFRQSITLSPRLELIARKIKCDRVIDVGTDHAYIPVYLILSGKCKRVIASDIRKKPLKRAKENITLFGVNDRVELRLSPGLENVIPEEVDDIIIAGMGAREILQIISSAAWIKQYCKNLILQPMADAEILRLYLNANGYAVVDEELVRDDGRIYTVISASCGSRTEKTEWLSQSLLESNDPLLKDYLGFYIRILTNKLNGLLKAVNPQSEIINKTKYDINILGECLNVFNSNSCS